MRRMPAEEARLSAVKTQVRPRRSLAQMASSAEEQAATPLELSFRLSSHFPGLSWAQSARQIHWYRWPAAPELLKAISRNWMRHLRAHLESIRLQSYLHWESVHRRERDESCYM